VVAATLVLAALAVPLSLRNHVDAELGALLPRDSAAAAALTKLTHRFGADQLLVVLIEGEPAAVAGASDRLASELGALPEVAHVLARMDASALAYLSEYVLLLLDDAEWAELVRRAGDPRAAARVRAALNSPAGGFVAAHLRADPLGALEMLGARLRASGRAGGAGGRFTTQNGRAALVLVTPRSRASDLVASARLLSAARARADAIGGVRVEFTGGPAYSVAYASAVQRDLALSTVASFVAVLLLFGLFFRTLRVLPAVALTLGISYVLTLGLWGAVVGRIGALSLAFGGILLGIGVDVPIQLWSRIREELCEHEPPVAVARAVRALAGVSAVATAGPALVFAACASSRFAGLRELGSLAALGLVVNWLVTLTFLPALLTLARRFLLPGRVAASTHGESWLEWLAAACARRPGPVLGAAATLLVAGLSLGAAQLRLAPHPLAFEAQLAPTQVEDRVSALFGSRRGRVAALVERPTLDEALLVAENATRLFGREGARSIESITDLLPSSRTLAARKARVLRDASSLVSRFRASVSAAGLDPDGFASFLDRVLAPPAPTWDALAGSGLGELVLARLVRVDRLSTTAAVYALPAVPEQVPALEGAAHFAGAVPTGAPVIEDEIDRTLPRDLAATTALSVGAVVLLLVLYYRSARKVAFVLVPLGVAWALFAALSPPLSVFTVLTVPLVIGYGIDDHVFLIDRSQAPAAPRRAVVLTSLATLAGFGSLGMASFAGVRALGAGGALAVVLCFAAAMLVLPALLGNWGGEAGVRRT
jgi:predicted exporter